jgi:hypothetical protein
MEAGGTNVFLAEEELFPISEYENALTFVAGSCSASQPVNVYFGGA